MEDKIEKLAQDIYVAIISQAAIQKRYSVVVAHTHVALPGWAKEDHGPAYAGTETLVEYCREAARVFYSSQKEDSPYR